MIRAAIPPPHQRLEHQAAPRSDARSNLKETIQSATDETVSRDPVLEGDLDPQLNSPALDVGDSDSPVQATVGGRLPRAMGESVKSKAVTPNLPLVRAEAIPFVQRFLENLGGELVPSFNQGTLGFQPDTRQPLTPNKPGFPADSIHSVEGQTSSTPTPTSASPHLPTALGISQPTIRAAIPPHFSQSQRDRVEPLLNSVELEQQQDNPESSALTGSKPQTSLKASSFRQQNHSTTSLTTASTPQTSTLEPTSNVKPQPSMVGRGEVLTKISPTLSFPTAFNHPAAPVQDEAAASDSPPLLARFTNLLRHSSTRYKSSRDIQPVPLVRSQLSSPPEIEPSPQAHLNSRQSMLSERRESALAQEASTPSIQVTIGRIEIRTTKSPPPSTPRSQPTQRGATLSLNDYLKQRHGGKP
jgi:hypothetical protein